MIHTPVLLQETVNSLNVRDGHTLMDGTLGGAGHACALLEGIHGGIFVGVDRDSEALDRSRRHLTNIPSGVTVHLVEGNFSHIKEILSSCGVEGVDRVLLDLGWGSHHLDSGRGFSFSKDEKLNMCYSVAEGGCAFDANYVVNEFEPEHLYDIIFYYGEERWAKRITEFILEARRDKRIETSAELADIVSRAVPRAMQPRGKHVATKTFQAIRIAVNDELGNLQRFLENVKSVVNPGARLAIITFHSIEDRLVKRAFRVWELEGAGSRLTKRGVKPTAAEVTENPRSRSARLRVFTFND